MAAVSENIVREFFELNGFFVCQQRKFIAPAKLEDDEIDFYVINPSPRSAKELPFILSAAEIDVISRAVVVVKGWHTDTFSPGFLASSPHLLRFLEGTVGQAARVFGENASFKKILVVPSLPVHEEARQQSVQWFKEKGLDGVMTFPTILQHLITRVEVNRNYQKSDLLQVIRILKNYDFFKDSQMELFKPVRRREGREVRQDGETVGETLEKQPQLNIDTGEGPEASS